MVTYTPAPRRPRHRRFTYTINDGRGGTATAHRDGHGHGAPNQPPVAVDDAATTPSGQPVTIDVLANDSDPDGDPLTVQSVAAPTLGTRRIQRQPVDLHAGGRRLRHRSRSPTRSTTVAAAPRTQR